MNKKMVIGLLIFFVFIIIGIGSYYFYQHKMESDKKEAKHAIEQYMEQQHILKENIVKIDMVRDSKRGLYLAWVFLKDDPKKVYKYTYYGPENISLDYLAKNNPGGGSVKVGKYPPLKEEKTKK